MQQHNMQAQQISARNQNFTNKTPPVRAMDPAPKKDSVAKFLASLGGTVEFQDAMADAEDAVEGPTADQLLNKKILRREMLSCLTEDKWPSDVKDRRPGFSNFTGVLCYRHSLFQAILHIPKFVNWIQGCHPPEKCCSQVGKACVACAFYKLSSLYWWGRTEDKKTITELLQDLDTILTHRGWRTDDYSDQGDPDEQFAKMMEFIAEDMGHHQTEQFRAIYSTLVGASIVCSVCDHRTPPNISELANFSIGLSPHLNGQKLKAFIKEYMEEHGIEGYRCEGCKNKVNVAKLTRIYSPADIVTVQIKRASYRGVSNTQIGLTERLNLTPYNAQDGVQLQYELVSTVCYVGNSRSGHYIAHGLGPNGDWRCFDDKSLSPSSVNQALGLDMRSRFEPVLLYYRRIYESKPGSNVPTLADGGKAAGGKKSGSETSQKSAKGKPSVLSQLKQNKANQNGPKKKLSQMMRPESPEKKPERKVCKG